MKPGVALACKPHPGEMEAARSREFEAGLTYMRTCQWKEGERDTGREGTKDKKKKNRTKSDELGCVPRSSFDQLREWGAGSPPGQRLCTAQQREGVMVRGAVTVEGQWMWGSKGEGVSVPRICMCPLNCPSPYPNLLISYQCELKLNSKISRAAFIQDFPLPAWRARPCSWTDCVGKLPAIS